MPCLFFKRLSSSYWFFSLARFFFGVEEGEGKCYDVPLSDGKNS
jgi:hypothetical protein